MIIAIDGPAGSGKSTIAKLIAEDLGLVYLDTGAMYRLVTLKALKDGILGNLDKIIKMLDNLNIDIKENGFYLDDIDVSEEIRKPVVSENVSDIAAIREVRKKMVDLQRKFSESKNVILDGRDIWWQMRRKGQIDDTRNLLQKVKMLELKKFMKIF